MAGTKAACGTAALTARLSALAQQYDAFILDQYGVLHNGTNACPGAIEALAHLHSLGKKMILLSNTSKREEFTISRLPSFGFEKEHFLGAVTSGEEAWQYLKTTGVGKKCTWLTWNNSSQQQPPRDYLNGLDIELTSIDSADFILAHGAEVVVQSREDADNIETSEFHKTGDLSLLKPLLAKGVERNLLLICANPDLISIHADGVAVHMPGKIAAYYESLGGKVLYFGKPHEQHFESCIEKLQLEKSRVVHVGDSLQHDIAGANAAGIDSIFVANGVHGSELNLNLKDGRESELDSTLLKELLDRTGHVPTHVVTAFSWK